jgi:hypothetical protein
MRSTPVACIKHYEYVIYRKKTDFIVRKHIVVWTNIVAYNRVQNNFIEQAPGLL